MRASTSSLPLFSLLLSLSLASLAQAEPAARSKAGNNKQLMDSNLFEAYLQHPESSHKRLPSEVINHHERDIDSDVQTLAPSAMPASQITSNASMATAPSSSAPSSSAYVFTPRQPNHLIKHRSRRQGKQRLGRRSSTLDEADDDQDTIDATGESLEHAIAQLTSDADQQSSSAQQPSRTEAHAHGALERLAELNRRLQQ